MGHGQLSTSLIETLSRSTSVMSRLANKCLLMTRILSYLEREPPFSFRSKPMCPLHRTHPRYHPPIHSGLCKVIHHRLPLNNRSRTSPIFLSNRSQTIHRQKSNHLIKIIRQRIYRRWLFLNSLCKITHPWLPNSLCKIIHPWLPNSLCKIIRKDIYQQWLLHHHRQCRGRTQPYNLYNLCNP